MSILGSSLVLTGDIHASSYDLKGKATVNVGPLSLTQASFELKNSGFTFTDSRGFANVFSGSVTTTIESEGQGYELSATATGSVFGTQITLGGDIDSPAPSTI